MGEAQNNKVEGTFIDPRKVNVGNQILNLPVTNLEINRFDGGRIVIKRSTTVIADRSIIPVTATNNANSSSSVTIFNNVAFSIKTGDSFILYDDDDMNDDGVKDGDEGDDVPMPQTTNWIQDSDYPELNRFAPAYVRPTYNIGDNNNNVPFVKNVLNYTGTDMTDLYDFDMKDYEASPDFWTVYLFGAYQGLDFDDCDPTDEDADGVIPDCTYGNEDSLAPNAKGVTVYMEVGRPHEYPPNYPNPYINRGATAAHELGHTFGGEHTDEGLMQISESRTEGIFKPITLAKIREAVHP